MEDFIKKIIREKKFFELSQSEKQSIHEWASNEEDFDALKSVLMVTQTMAAQNESQLSPHVKRRLDDRFTAKYGHQNDTAWNKFLIFFFPKDKQFFKKPAFQLAMVALVVVLVIPFLWQNKPAQYAMNDERNKLEVEKHKIESLKENQAQDQFKQDVNTEKSKKVPELGKQDTPQLEEEYLLDNIESVSSDDAVNKGINLNELRSKIEKDAPTFDDIEEVSEAPSPSIVSAQKRSANSSTIAQVKGKVETLETLDLLTALY
jgi:hypothetical protein